jgi:imidazolonepropionase-like amidohydrolase
MNEIARRSLLRGGAALGAAAVVAAPGRRVRGASDAVVLEHARIHPGDGRRIDDGSLVVRGGHVVALGPTSEIKPPAGARRIDGQGLWITPGLIDAESSTGLADIFAERSSVETHLDDRYDAVRAAFSVLDGLNPRAVTIPVTRIAGVTSSVLAPEGGLVSGQGALVHLSGDSVPQMLLRAPIGIYVSLAADGRAAAYGARGGLLLRLRELFDDVRVYARRRGDFERNQLRKVAASRLDLEALVPVIERKVPLVVEAQRASDIQSALSFARDQRLDIILTGCEEGWIVGREIAAAKVPVVLSALPNLPRSFEALGARLDNAALLAKAGVKLAISPRSRSDHFSRTLRFEAGTAVANGLPWETALAAVTRHPAEIFAGRRPIGTLAPGRLGDIAVWTGDPFEPLSLVRHVFIAGREVPLRSRQTELFERYRALSKPAGPSPGPAAPAANPSR